MIKAHRFVFVGVHAVVLVLKHHPQLEEALCVDDIGADDSLKYALFLRLGHPLKQFFEARCRKDLTIPRLEEKQLAED